MGNGSSKPEQHLFNADAPVRFSQSIVDSLQQTTQTDSIRAKDLELKIQARVNSELQRIRDSQSQQLTDLTASLTTDPPKEDANPLAPHRDPNSLAAHLSSPFYQDHSSPTGPAAAQKPPSDRTHDSVQSEIMGLRQKLEARKKLDKLPPPVERAKDEVVSCLRLNDRRPLDCWQEVEKFRFEVGRMEQDYIKKVGH